jgi:hypothetical protein
LPRSVRSVRTVWLVSSRLVRLVGTERKGEDPLADPLIGPGRVLGVWEASEPEAERQ